MLKNILKELGRCISMKTRNFIFFLLGAITVGFPWFVSCLMIESHKSDNIFEDFRED